MIAEHDRGTQDTIALHEVPLAHRGGIAAQAATAKLEQSSTPY
jgi:hypothetical protein